MYNGLSAGNQRVLNTLVGSSETTRENHIILVRYSPVKYESTYGLDINRINLNYYSCIYINIDCIPIIQIIILNGLKLN